MMSFVKGSTGFGGKLNMRKVPAQSPAKVKSLRTPLGRFMFTRDKGSAKLLGEHYLMSNLRLIHRGPDGVIKDVRDTGSGLVTNAGVNVMSYDYTWAGGATLKQMNFHSLGTGVTAAAASDVWLQTQIATPGTNFSATTNGYMTGTQSVIANSTSTPWSPVYQTQATFTCTGGAGIAITEWILALSNAANIAGTASATSSTTLTGTGFTTTGNGLQAWTVEALASGAIPVNTPTTNATLQVSSNSATVLTGLDNIWASGVKSWLSLANQAVATPSATTLYVVFPTAFDHKTFGAVTLNNGDTLQVTYQLSINSGG